MSTRRIVVPTYQPVTLIDANGYTFKGAGFLVVKNTNFISLVPSSTPGTFTLNLVDQSGAIKGKIVTVIVGGSTTYNASVTTQPGILAYGDKLSASSNTSGTLNCQAIQCATLAAAVAIA